jgi:acyl-CoA synthetase (AMP-forming)/AMP-acid ligase II
MSNPNLLEWPPTMPELLRRAAMRFGNHELVVTEEGERISYSAMEDRSRLLARRLLAAGVGKGCRVGILFPQGPAWLVAYFALARIGAISVAISTFAKPPELHKILRHSDAHALLVASTINGEDQHQRLEQAVAGLSTATHHPLFLPSLPYLRSIWVEGGGSRKWAEQLPADDSHSLAPEEILDQAECEVHPADPLVVIYTSGTTSQPKGVLHGHGALVRHGENLRRLGAVVEGDRVYAGMPLFWVGGLSLMLGPTLHSGATLLMQQRFQPAGALKLIREERATVLVGWATVLQRIIDHPEFAEIDVSTLRLDPRVRRGGLGMTETCGQHSWRRPGEDIASVGSAVPGVEHRVVDPGTNETATLRAKGEICVRGYCVCLGMVKTERHDVFDQDGWYHTGDGGWIDERGTLYFDGRLNDMIKTNGNNVAPAEIEAALMAHPAIQFASAFGLPHPAIGEEVAMAVVCRETAIDVVELQDWMRQRVASYKVPTRVLVMSEGDVPLLASGKPDKVTLASMVVDLAESSLRGR